MIFVYIAIAVIAIILIDIAVSFLIIGKVPHVEIKVLHHPGDDITECCAPGCDYIAGTDYKPKRRRDDIQS